MTQTLIERAREILASKAALATALAVMPLAAEEASARGAPTGFDVTNVQIGDPYGGFFQEGTQYTWTDTQGPDRVDVCIALGPILGGNPFNSDPPPDPPPASVFAGFLIDGLIYQQIPLGSRVRVSYEFRVAHTGGTVEVLAPWLIANSYNEGGGGFAGGMGTAPGIIASGSLVAGSFETEPISAYGDFGDFHMEMYFLWDGFAPTDTLTWDWCMPEYLRIELIRPTPPPCPGDANGDGVVNFGDITSVLVNFGNNYLPGTGPGDANRDGVVNFSDVTSVLVNFGAVCPP